MTNVILQKKKKLLQLAQHQYQKQQVEIISLRKQPVDDSIKTLCGNTTGQNILPYAILEEQEKMKKTTLENYNALY